MLPFKLRRALSINIPLFAGLLLIGIIGGFFGISIEENIAQTGIKVSTVFGVLLLWHSFQVFKHRIP